MYPKFDTCCSLDIDKMELKMVCPNSTIRYVEVLHTVPNSFAKLVYEQRFPITVYTVILKLQTDTLVNETIINIWTNNYKINDYTIYVYPKNWINKGVVYGHYSYR